MKEIKTQNSTLEKAKTLKVTVLRSLRDKGKGCTYREIECHKCKSIYPIQDQTFSRWAKAGKEYCGYCNGSQKALPPELKTKQLNDKLVGTVYEEIIQVREYLGYRSKKDQAFCIIEFISCKHSKEYSTSVFGHMLREGKAFRCDTCDNPNTSEMETVVGAYLPPHYLPQVPYASIAECGRKWVADFYSIRDNTLIEVSTGHTKERQDYSGNLKEKQEWCANSQVEFIFISSLNDLEDIVRSLGKPRGANT